MSSQPAQRPNGPGAGYVATRSFSATKGDTPILETPQTVSVVTRQQIEDQGAQNVGQALRYSSGLSPETRAASTLFDFPTARGFVPDTYLDGLKIPVGNLFNIAQPNIYNLDRIEYLRGPASVLYGQASPGGILNLTSKRPMDVPFHELQFLTGSYGRVQGAFDFSGPLNDEKTLLYRLSGIGFTGGTQVNSTKSELLAISPALTWRPDADTTLTILGDYVNTPAGYYDNVPAYGSYLPNPPAGQIPTHFFAGEPGFNSYSREQASIGYLFEHHVDETWTVRQNLRYTDVTNRWNTILSTVSPNIGQGLINRYVFTNDSTFDGLTLDNQAEAKFSTGPIAHTMLFGIDFQRVTADEKYSTVNRAPPINFLNPVYGTPITPGPLNNDSDTTSNQLGLYLQDQMKFDKWVLLLGGRQDFADSNRFNRLNQTTTTTDDRAFSGRAGLVYLFDNGLAPYVSYTESFQPLVGTNSSGNPFKPTTGQQYEAGVKYQPVGYNAFVTVSAFDLRQQNVRTPDPTNPLLSVQTGEITSRGVEVSGNATLNKNINLIASYSYLDTTVTKSNSTNLGKVPVQVPTNTASLWAAYTWNSGPIDGLTVGGGVRYVGETFGDALNLYRVPGFTLFDAMVRYDLGKLSPSLKGFRVQVNANNLFDKTYVASCNSAPDFCFYGLRRSIYGSLTYRW